MAKGKAWRRVWRFADYFDRIVTQIEQGKTLKEVARTIPARPSQAAISHFLHSTPERWQRYQEARAVAGRLHRIPEQTYARALTILATTDHPHQKHWQVEGLPNLDTMRARSRRDPAFKKRLDCALEFRRRRIRPKRFKPSDYDRALDFIEGHADKTQLEIDPLLRAAFLPSIFAVQEFARRGPRFRERYRLLNEKRGVIRFTPDGFQSALEALRADPHTACTRILPERVGLIPSALHIRSKLRNDPALAAQYQAVMIERREARGRPLPSIRRIRPVNSITTKVPADLVARAQSLVPRWATAALAEDIRSELVLAVLSGRCTMADLAGMARKVANRLSGVWTVSTDAQIGTGGGSLSDILTADRYTFEDAI